MRFKEFRVPGGMAERVRSKTPSGSTTCSVRTARESSPRSLSQRLTRVLQHVWRLDKASSALTAALRILIGLVSLLL